MLRVILAGAVIVYTASILRAGGNEPPSPEKQAEAAFKKDLEKAARGLVARFDAAIVLATEKGQLADVRRLQADKAAFEKDDVALPYHPAMAAARTAFETACREAKANQEKASKAAVVRLTRAKMLDEAERVQGALAEVSKIAFVPRDVTDDLPGAWRVSFVGRTKSGPAIDYQATWEFEKSGIVRSVEAKASGTWTYEPKTRRVVITWDNQEKSQESFPLPLVPSGLTGQTWHGPGVKFTAARVK